MVDNDHKTLVENIINDIVTGEPLHYDNCLYINIDKIMEIKRKYTTDLSTTLLPN